MTEPASEDLWRPGKIISNYLFFLLPHFSVEIDYEPVGCFRDKRFNRALDKLVISFRGGQNLEGKTIWDYWEKDQMNHIIQLCAEEAFRQGYTMVGLQHFGECWSGEDAEKNYDRHGMSKNCINGVGKASTNYVYRIKGK